MLKKGIVIVAAILLVLDAMAGSSFPAQFQRNGTIIGNQGSYRVRKNDTLFEIARSYDLGYDAIAAANPATDPFLPEPGRFLVIPAEWILPKIPKAKGIVINRAEMRLYFFTGRDSPTVVTYPIGIGDEGKDTPLGTFSIVEKIKDPVWHVPESIQREKPELPAAVPPGPDNPLGSHALRLSDRTVLIHGTNRPWGIGTRNTHGCIRLYPEDIVELFTMVEAGTGVAIVSQPVKVAVWGKEVYLEVHAYEEGGNLYWEALNILAAKNLKGSVNLDKVRRAVRERSGLLVNVSP